jgi:hypothetical protein
VEKNTEPLCQEDATLLAQTLTLIPGFGFQPAAIEATAADLIEWCEGTDRETPKQQARWLVREARYTWDKWGGTKGLYDLFLNKYAPEALVPSTVLDYGPKPEIECRQCGDTGTFQNQEQVFVFCRCPQGAKMKQNPGESWLKLLNKKPQQQAKQ